MGTRDLIQIGFLYFPFILESIVSGFLQLKGAQLFLVSFWSNYYSVHLFVSGMEKNGKSSVYGMHAEIYLKRLLP